MLDHPATIELIEKLGELAKNFGAILVAYAKRLNTERQSTEEKQDRERLKASLERRTVVSAVNAAKRNREL
jgi:Sec-independent protein translocase protein TatA